MIKYFIFILFIFFQLRLFSQNYSLPDIYYDESITNSIIQNQNIEVCIVFQTMLDGDSILIGDDENKIVTFLIWYNGDTTSIKLITKDYIFGTKKIFGNKIFKYKNIDNTGVDLNECTLNFVEPGLSPINSEIVIYISMSFS